MGYIISLVIASLVGIFGFIINSSEKEKLDKQHKLQSLSLYNSNPNLVTKVTPAVPLLVQPKVSGPLAIVGIIVSVIVSILSFGFFFRKNQQQKRNQFSKLNSNQKNRLASLRQKLTNKSQGRGRK